MTSKLVILCITSLLLLIPIAGATYDVVSGIASNSTEYTTTASYTELHNISLATGDGTVFIKASWDARVNFSAPLYGRFVRDGVSLGRFNLTQSVYAQVGSYELSLNETTGTHYYGFEVYSNKKGTIYSRNFSAVFLKNGTYGTDTAASISALQANDTYFNSSTFPNSTNFRNDTISTKTTLAEVNSSAQISRSQVTGQEGLDTTQNASISNLQVNDTYFNGTIFPNSTQFRNDSISTKEPAISQGASPQFWMFNKTWQNITTTWITEGTNQWFTDAKAISAVQAILNMMNTSSATNNTNSQARDDIINSTKVNKTNAGELSGGTLAYSIFPINITYGGGAISFSNGTNAISVGTSKKKRQVTDGVITALYVNQTNDAACTGNVTITSSGVYKTHLNWTSANNASKTGLSSSFTAGEWLLYNMTENTGCIDFTFEQVHTKTS